MCRVQESSLENSWDPVREQEAMQNGCGEGSEGTREALGAQGRFSPPWVVFSLLPFPTKLPNIYFKRMGDEGDRKPWTLLPFPCDGRDHYAVPWLQEPFLDREQQQRVRTLQKRSDSTEI